MTDTWDLLVLGGGTAGLVGAYTAAALGARVALVERHRTGGDCLWTGCVPSKALQAAASRVAAVRRPPAYLTSGSVSVDFSRVMGEVRGAIAAIEPVDSIEALTEAGVTVLTGHASFAETGSVSVDGERHDFHHALVATGAEPVVPLIPGLDHLGPVTTETVWDLDDLPDRLLVVGGGPAGCELAQAFARLGSEVTLVEKGGRLLRHVDPDASAAVRRALAADGVRVLTDSVLVDVEARSGRVRVTGTRPRPSDTTSSHDVTVDRLLVAVGRRSRAAGIGLERAGVSLTRRGAVAVDATLRTSNPHIWAAGDVTAYPHQTHVAAAHASLAVTNALLGTRRRADRLVVPRVVFTDPEVAHVGADTWAERGARPPRTITRTHDHVDRAIAEARTDGFSRLALDRRGSRIVGATLVSPRAGESVAALTLAIEKGMSPTALAATVHAYPTYNDGPWTAAVDEIRRRLRQPGARRAVGALLAGRRAQWRRTPR